MRRTTKHRSKGHSAPRKRAFNDVYEMIYGDDPDRPDPEKFAKTLKRKFHPALRDLKLQKEAAERMNAWTRGEKRARNSRS